MLDSHAFAGRFRKRMGREFRPIFRPKECPLSDKKAVLVALGAVSGLVAIILASRLVAENPISIRGAVIVRDSDPDKQVPIAGVDITVTGAEQIQSVRSDASGFFTVTLRERLRRAMPITIHFLHPDYQPLDWKDLAADKLYVARLTPVARPTPAPASGPETKISNVVAQYSIVSTTAINVGSAVKTFRVANAGDVPCRGKPCSPDGKWQAALGSAVMDAGPGNEFHNARASCIAGPCPFTKIENDTFSRDTRSLRISVLDWSDPTTFLVEAEVFKPLINDVARQSYPLIFGRALTFTLPAAAESVSIQAEIDAAIIVFPLGPALELSWANCQVVLNPDKTKVYRCELKPGYRFS